MRRAYPTTDAMLERFNHQRNKRKLLVYWLGFLEGVLSSQAIEPGEPEALVAETQALLELIFDEDASDVIQDLSAKCCSSENDLLCLISDILEYKMDTVCKLDNSSDANDDKTRALGFLAGVICDGRVLSEEVRAIGTLFDNLVQLRQSPIFRKLAQQIDRALSTPFVPASDASEIYNTISDLVGAAHADSGLPHLGHCLQTDLPSDLSSLKITESVFVITGKTSRPRAELSKRIVLCGGFVSQRVTKKTNYLIVGHSASRDWKTTSYGHKIEYASKLISSGATLQILPEDILELAVEKHLKN